MADKENSRGKFSSLLILLQGLLLIIFVVFVEYDADTIPEASNQAIIDSKYPVFQDVHTLVIVGFGLLLIFLKKYGFSGLGYTFLIAGVTMQWAATMDGFLNMKNDKLRLGINSLITGDLATLTVIITFGAILGKTSNLQLVVIAFFEVIYYIVNRNICTKYLQAVDYGGGMYIHLFGSCFGLMVARVLFHKRAVAHENETSRYTSDLFAATGTLFLWVYWPSLNAVLLDRTLQYRAIVNTYYALTASCVTAFGLSSLITKGSKLSMVYIQNATLAGGVAVASIAAMIIQPWGAILIGLAGGFVSTLGYKYFQPFLIRRLSIHDTSGVSSLHGLPGILAGISSAISSGLASYSTYKTSLYIVFPARAPVMNSTQYLELVKTAPGVASGLGRTAGVQAGCQLAALAITITIAIVGGIITGVIAKTPFLSPLTDNMYYSDTQFWEVPEDYHSLQKPLVQVQRPTPPSARQTETLLMQEISDSSAAVPNNISAIETIT